MRHISGLSVFANVGIGEFFLKESGINIVVANEVLADRAAFYKKLHPNADMVIGDITNEFVFQTVMKKSKEQKVDFIIATPPCQAMSVASQVGRKRNDINTDDQRNYLILKAIQAIKELQPRYAMLENVVQMENTRIIVDGCAVTIKDLITKSLGTKYNLSFNKLDAADYGTPQHRRRLFVLIAKKPNTWEVGDKTNSHTTVHAAISHLPSLESNTKSSLPWHFMRKLKDEHIHWMKNTKTGQSAYENEHPEFQPTTNDKNTREVRLIKAFSTAYKRMKWDEPAPTITLSSSSISGQCNVHPGRKIGKEWSDARPLTVREISILSGLPECWLDGYSEDDYNERFFRDVIGECAAPKMVQFLIDSISEDSISTFDELFRQAG